MYIYHYSRTTGEYLSKSIADADPVETKKQGKFVPLIPAYATLLEPPETEENETPVFTNGVWSLTADYRKTHKKCDDNFIITDITELGEITDGYLVTNEVAALIKETPAKFKISDGAVVELSDEEYAEYLKEVEAERIANLSLTAADVERAIYKAKGMDFDDIVETVEAMNEAGTADIDIKALKIELKANYFYRGNDYVEQIGTLLGYSSDDLDYLFENGEIPDGL